MSELEDELDLHLRGAGVQGWAREYLFHPTRKWRFDFAFHEHLLAVEIVGGIYRGGGHTSVTGLKRDIEKERAATLLGWRLLRFHGDEVHDGTALRVIEQALRDCPPNLDGQVERFREFVDGCLGILGALDGKAMAEGRE